MGCYSGPCRLRGTRWRSVDRQLRQRQINAYNPATGEFIDKVRNPHGQAIVIDGLWTLRVGNGGNGGLANTIYFTAGPNGEKDGLFGSLMPE